MSKAEHSAMNGNPAWNNHIFQAAKSFLKCAVAIDDRPFGGGKPAGVGKVPQSNEAEPRVDGFEEPVTGPIPRSPKTARLTTTKITTVSRKAMDKRQEGSEARSDKGSDTHDFDLRALTDSFAEQGIICGTLIPDGLEVESDTGGRGEQVLITRAQKMAQTADILILDWFLKKRNCETTLKIIDAVLKADKHEGGRTRLICIYTGENQLQEIRDQVKDRLRTDHDFNPNPNDDVISLLNQSTSIVFINKKKVESPYTVAERDLPKRLIKEFTALIDGLLPSFAASSIGAIRRNTHGLLSIFCAGLDPAYVGNRAISDPSGEMAELVREMLVSEFDNQIGFGGSADKYLSKDAISCWLKTPGRVQNNCAVTLTKQAKGQGSKEAEKRIIDAALIQRAACGDIVTFDKAFVIDGDNYKINEKERLKFTQALCKSQNEANRIEHQFARLASNKHEAYGRETTKQNWHPSLTLGTLLLTTDAKSPDFYMCITRACDMIRLSKNTKRVVLLRLEKVNNGFNLVIPDTKDTVAKLFVPREFSGMRNVEFKVDSTTQRITAKEEQANDDTYFRFHTKSGDTEYRYLGELRYLRALRDVNEMIRRSTAIGVADSEWLRLSERI